MGGGGAPRGRAPSPARGYNLTAPRGAVRNARGMARPRATQPWPNCWVGMEPILNTHAGPNPPILHAILSPVSANTQALKPTLTILNTQHHHYTPILYAILKTPCVFANPAPIVIVGLGLWRRLVGRGRHTSTTPTPAHFNSPGPKTLNVPGCERSLARSEARRLLGAAPSAQAAESAERRDSFPSGRNVLTQGLKGAAAGGPE